MNVYRLLGRLARPFALLCFYAEGLVYKRPRVRVAAVNEYGQVLLVKSWIGRQAWELPGGGANRGEQWSEAARRELYEETGIGALADELVYVCTAKGYGGCDLPIFTVSVRAADLPKLPHNNREIIAISWQDPTNLTGVTPLVTEVVAKLVPRG